MTTPAPPGPAPFSGYQKFIVGLLAFLQFTIVLDFMILSPLGALLLKELQIPPSRFGLVVSAYAFSAGISGLLAAGFADRFDRKRLLLFFYAGFVLGTVLCAVAPSYHFLLVARIITGLFGGVISSISFAIIADLFPPQARGRVMGVVQSSFAASQVMGIPLGLWLANHWSWHAPFWLIVAVSAAVGVVIVTRMQPVTGHLANRAAGSAFRHLLATITQRDYLPTYALTMLIVTGGFMLMPFGSAFTVNNMGISLAQLPVVFLVTGLFAMTAGPLVGRLSDTIGTFRVFVIGTLVSLVLVVVFTNLGVTPLMLVLLVNVVLMLGLTMRMIAASALTSMVPDPPQRGSFMAVQASIQQLAGGVASAVAGLIVVQTPGGALLHYNTLGYIVVVAMLITVALLHSINRMVTAKLTHPPLRAAV